MTETPAVAVVDAAGHTWFGPDGAATPITSADLLARAAERPRPGQVDVAAQRTVDAAGDTTDQHDAPVAAGRPVAVLVGGGSLWAYDDTERTWTALGRDHLEALAANPEAMAVPGVVADLLRLGGLSRVAAEVPRSNLVGDARAATVVDPSLHRAVAGAGPGPSTDPSALIPVHSFYATSDGPPVGVASVVAYARVHDGGRLTDTFDLRQMISAAGVLDALRDSSGPAVVLCGNYVWSVDANLEVARAAQAINGEVIVLHGGPSTPVKPHECEAFLRDLDGPHAAIAGEGENTFVEILDRLAACRRAGEPVTLRALRDVPGVRFIDPDTGEYAHGPDRPRHATLEDFPSPFTSGEFDLVPAEHITVLAVETNRGCPYSCSFCDWGSATMSRIRAFSIDRVMGDLAWLAEHQVSTWYFADANFGILPRDAEIARTIAEHRRSSGFPDLVVAFPSKNATDRYLEIVDSLTSAGIILRAALALQTRDAATLDTIHRSNIRTESYDRLARESKARHLPIVTELMIGLPGSTVGSLQADLQWCIDNGVRAFLYDTMVLPNAPMNEPEYRELLQIRTVDGRIVSTSSFTADDRARMDRIVTAYQVLEVLGTARHVLRYLQWDHGRRAVDVIAAVSDEVHAHPERHPLISFMLLHGRDFLLPPVGWGPFYDELHALLTGPLGIEDSSGLRVALAASRHLVTWPERTLPSTIPLEHDYVGWYEADRSEETPAPALETHGPGTLEIESDPLGVAARFGRYPDTDPFLQAFDFELETPLSLYHSALRADAAAV